MAAAGGGAAAGRAYSFKVVLLGEGCVGKTSLVLRYCENKFNDKHITTLQVRPGGGGGAGPRGLGRCGLSGCGAHGSQACPLRLGMALSNSPWGEGGRPGSWQPADWKLQAVGRGGEGP